MNWDALGAIAEAVGALAVLATLIYLSVQIRQSARSQDRQNEIAMADLFMQRAGVAIDLVMRTCDPEVARSAVSKFYTGQSIEDSEFEDYAAYVNAVLTLHETHYQLNALGLLPEEQWEQTQAVLQRIVQFPRFQEVWSRHSIRYSNSFGELIEQAQRRAERGYRST